MKPDLKLHLTIALGALLLFLPFLGSVHLFDWDEINFAECAREMLATGDYFSVTINYQPFWEKPPVFIWMQALCMNLFGVSEFSARLPNALCGVFTLLLLFNTGSRLYDKRFGLLWTLAYAGSFLPHFYFKSGIMDPWFNFFIFYSILFFIRYANNNFQEKKSLIFSALLIGLAILVKGPVAFLIFALCAGVFFIINRSRISFSVRDAALFIFTMGSVGGLWFLMLVFAGQGEIIKEFFIYQIRLFNTQDAGHGGPFFYHWLVLLIGCFPVSVFAIASFRKRGEDTPYQKYFKTWMIILFWVVLLLFSIVKTKIIHYSSLCYFPLSFLGAYIMYKLWIAEMVWKRYMSILLAAISFFIGAALSALPVLNYFKEEIIRSGVIKDKFAVENLNATVHESGFEWLLGFILFSGTIICLLLIHKGRTRTGIAGIFLLSLLCVNAASAIITPRIEPYTQGAAIEFYKYLSQKDCYIETLGFKSYAHLYYSDRKPVTNKNSHRLDWLVSKNIDKPAFFVCKITYADEARRYYPLLKEIYRKNGFVFLWNRPH